MRNTLFEPLVLSTFIRTVGIIIHAAAPSAINLREMTREYWDFLLSVRNVSDDPSVTEAVLFGILLILEITEARHAAEHFPKQVVATQTWVAGPLLKKPCLIIDIFQNPGEGKAKMFAGGILLKLRDIVAKHERLLLGDIISFGSISSAPMGLNFR